MIELQSLSFGAFAEVEPFNPAFVPGRPKLRLTVDVGDDADASDARALERLVECFPGLARHQCRGPAHGNAGALPPGGVRLVDGDPSANRAHLLEHVIIEMLSHLQGSRRLSGVTCARLNPPIRSDVFVECTDHAAGGLAALLALETLRAALKDEPLAPGYRDALACLGILLESAPRAWSPARLGRRLRLPPARAAAALDLLRAAHVAEAERFALNLSGEDYYRLGAFA